MFRQLPAILAIASVCFAAASSVPEQQSSDVAKVSGAAPRQLSWWWSSSSSSSSEGGAASSTADGTSQKEPLTSIIATAKDAFYSQLSSHKGQSTNALAALVVGAVLLVDGELTFKWILIMVFFVGMAIAAKNEFAAAWGLDSDAAIVQLVGIEAGIVAAYGALLGLEGIMIGLGAFLGAAVAHWIKRLLLNLGQGDVEENVQLQLMVVGIYTACILGGVYAVRAKKYAKVVALVAPFAGSALVSSALSFFATHAALKGSMDSLYKVFPETMSPVAGPWIDFFLLLCNNDSKDVGIFAETGKTTVILKEPISQDRMFGLLLMLVLFVFGAMRQLKVVRRSEAVTSTASITKDLQQRLLKDQV